MLQPCGVIRFKVTSYNSKKGNQKIVADGEHFFEICKKQTCILKRLHVTDNAAKNKILSEALYHFDASLNKIFTFY